MTEETVKFEKDNIFICGLREQVLFREFRRLILPLTVTFSNRGELYMYRRKNDVVESSTYLEDVLRISWEEVKYKQCQGKI